MNVEFAVVVVDPAALDDASVDTVKSDDVGCAEECIRHQTEHTGNGVLSENIQCVVNTYIVFYCDLLDAQKKDDDVGESEPLVA